MTRRFTTRDKLTTMALSEGWKRLSPTMGMASTVDTFRRGGVEVTAGYTLVNTSPVLRWCALFRDGEPIARYGLFAEEGPGTSGGEIKLHVPNKAAIVSSWLREVID
jgi:hypothetical protein